MHKSAPSTKERPGVFTAITTETFNKNLDRCQANYRKKFGRLASKAAICRRAVSLLADHLDSLEGKDNSTELLALLSE